MLMLLYKFFFMLSFLFSIRVSSTYFLFHKLMSTFIYCSFLFCLFVCQNSVFVVCLPFRLFLFRTSIFLDCCIETELVNRH